MQHNVLDYVKKELEKPECKSTIFQ